MYPELWGKHLWRSIHYISLGYPIKPTAENAEQYRQFFSNLWKVIPCEKCALNYKRHLDELPIDVYLKDNAALFEWTVKLHNIVNRELGKNEMSFEDAKKMYLAVPRSCKEKWTYALLILVIILLLLYLLRDRWSRANWLR